MIFYLWLTDPISNVKFVYFLLFLSASSLLLLISGSLRILDIPHNRGSLSFYVAILSRTYSENTLHFISLLLHHRLTRRTRFPRFRCGSKPPLFIILPSIPEELLNHLAGKPKGLGVVGSFFMPEGPGVATTMSSFRLFARRLSTFSFSSAAKMLDSRLSWSLKCFGDRHYWDTNFLLFVLAMEYGTSYSPKRVWALTACQGRITDYMTNFAAFGHDTPEDSIILARHAQKNFHFDVNDVSL